MPNSAKEKIGTVTGFMPFVHQDGATYPIKYRRWESIDAVPEIPRKHLLCLHGLTLNSQMFAPLAEHLALTGNYVVWAYNYPGREGSAKLANPKDYTHTTYAALLRQFVAFMGVETLSLFGTSMGGITSFLTLNILSAQVSALILNDIGPHIPHAALQDIARYAGREPSFASFREARTYMRQQCANWGPLTEEDLTQLTSMLTVEEGGRLTRNYDPAIREAFDDDASQDLLLWSLKDPTGQVVSGYDTVACPTLILRGETSPLLLPETAQAMLDRRPATTELHVIPATGHACPMRHRAEIEIVQTFLDRQTSETKAS